MQKIESGILVLLLLDLTRSENVCIFLKIYIFFGGGFISIVGRVTTLIDRDGQACLNSDLVSVGCSCGHAGLTAQY